MRKMIQAVFFAAAVLMLSVTVSADSGLHITEYYSSEDNITAFTSGNISDGISAMISGTECSAENKGDIYHNAEKYETVFLIDSSKSMGNFSDEIRTFLAECIDKKRDNEYYSFGLFSSGNSPDYIISCENRQYALEKSLDELRYDFESTYIYDNLMNTFSTLCSDDEPIYRRVVLITDGNENSARGITIDDVLSELSQHPVPVFTVSLQFSDKSNVEALKNIGRLARASYAEDMRIADGGDAIKPASILFDSAQNVCEITITPKGSLLDGSVRAVEISDGSISVRGDVRMAMVTAADSGITEPVQSAPAETVKVTEAVPEKKNVVIDKKLLIFAVGIAALIGITAAVIIIVKRNKKPEHTEISHQSIADNEETMMLGTESRETEMLIDDNRHSRYHTLILRDAADSVRTFEVQLSEDGAVIGRSSDMSSIVIDYDRSVSRKHCRIYIKGSNVYAEDLGSGNKTYVNDKEVFSPVIINNSDELRVGRTRLKVTLK